MFFFNKQPTDNQNRPPSQNEERLILELRKLSSADVEIGLSDSQPNQVKLFNTSFLDIPSDNEITNEELTLLQVLRFMKFGMAKIHVESGQWTGELLPETHITVKF